MIPKPYYQDAHVTLYCGDCVATMKTMPDNSVDSIVTDPPYGLGFMGKGWDATVPGVEVWIECLRILKPGGHLLAFAGTRTQHRMACAIEDAGFEIRDMIAWVYGSGFPKSLDVSKAIDKAAGAEREVVGIRKLTGTARIKGQAAFGATSGRSDDAYQDGSEINDTLNITAPATEAARQWQGWGTALKPSLEPITMARKPLIGTVAANVMEYGTGGINVDGCRVGTEEIEWKPRGESVTFGKTTFADRTGEVNKGRWPANLILSHSPECICTGVKRVKGSGWAQSGSKASDNKSMSGGNYARDPKPDAFADSFGYETVESYNCIEGCPVRLLDEQSGEDCFGDTGGASRFFYTAKADKSERRQSKHPTVKPLDLIRYLVRMVTPEGGVVLDPFLGSGTLCEAARAEHCLSIGIELDAAYCADAVERLRQGVLF